MAADLLILAALPSNSRGKGEAAREEVCEGGPVALLLLRPMAAGGAHAGPHCLCCGGICCRKRKRGESLKDTFSGLYKMDHVVQSLQNAYTTLVAAIATYLEAKEASDAHRIARSAAATALEKVLQSWQLFQVACDEAQEFVESVRQRIGSECLVDEATGSISTTQTMTNDRQRGLPPLSAVRLEQMSKTVRWLVLELQHGPSTPGAASSQTSGNSLAPAMETRQSEDLPQ